jgi:allantoin racemase
MKILWIVPVTSVDEIEIENTAKFLEEFIFRDTKVTIRKVSRGTESIESRVDEAYATIPILEEVLKGEQEGYDACVVACAGNAGVSMAKEIATIPVIGAGEASFLLARMIGKKIVVLTMLPERVPSLEENLERYIAGNQFFIYPANIPVVEIRKDINRTIKILTEIIENSIIKDRADTAILACLTMRGMASEIQKRVHIPVIDPVIAAIELAQVIVKMKIAQSKGAYPLPRKKKRIL